MIYKLVDTNILYDYFAKTTYFNQAKAVLSQTKIVILQEVLTELYNLLRSEKGVNFAADTVRHLLEAKNLYQIVIDTSKHYQPALQICKKLASKYPKKDLSLIDAMQISYCRDHTNLHLYTTEGRMTNQGFIMVTQPYSHKTA
jgi:predicted nucleic acid-binding protein